MENRDIQKILEQHDSTFSLIIAVAKRSRDISESAQHNKVELVGKPVNIAMQELINGTIKVVE
ncbi:MAG: DNA-directed RNA polymerase subunit omega [Oscillospiraceae bacterium]|nr:DNA-directed RNA polymerase subunit omega [Oscillospiraceae bacterium]